MVRISKNTKFSAGSFAASLLICSKVINSCIAQIYSGSIPTGLITMGFIWAIVLCQYIANKKRTCSTYGTIFLGYILMFFLYSNFKWSGHIREITLQFIEYGVLGFLIGGIEFQYRNISKYVCFIMLGLFFPAMKVIIQDIEEYGLVTMSNTYVFLPAVMVAFCNLLFYPKESKILNVSSVLSGSILVILLLKGTRGAVVCIFTMIIFLMLNSKKVQGRFGLGKYIVYLLLILLIINIGTILNFFYTLLMKFDINIRFLEKSVQLIKYGDITNGRTDLTAIALSDFMKSPIYGHGIGAFPELHSINYPHNIVLQLLVEGGLLLALPVMGVSLYGVYLICEGKIKDKDFRNLLILIASSTLPATFFSGELWNYQLLWLFFGVIVKNGTIYR